MALAVVLLWPMTRDGYLLGHDMVFTPRQPLGLASVGVSSASPRAVPVDALVALAERIVDGAVVGRLAVLVPVLAAGLGAAALLSARSRAAGVVACGFAIWNPYVVERLALGHWALLWSYAALPWLVLAVARPPSRWGWFARALTLAAASITPTGGLIAAATAMTASAGSRRPRRETAAVAALAVLMQLPWVVPALTSSASATSDPAAVTAFAARAEHSGGVLLTLLAGGGIWDADVVPDSRAGLLPWLGLAVLAATAVLGLRPLTRRLGRPLVATLLALAGAGLLIALASSVPGADAAVRAVVEHVPGAGLLRDAQKWIAPWMLMQALLAGAAVDAALVRLPAAHWRTLLVTAGLAAPLLLLPDAAATLRPTFEPVHYPSDWAQVADAADGGVAAVVPFGSYRLFDWAPGRAVLDPAPRLLRIETVVDDRLAVDGRLLQGEDLRAREVAAALAAGPDLPRRLASAGISWVVVEHATPGAVPDLAGLTLRRAGADVSLYRVPPPVASTGPSAARVAAVVAVDALALAVLVGLAAWAVAGRRDVSRQNEPARQQP